jgi:ketosteroid isomerase-like protein
MATDNLSLLREGYQAFAAGDMARLAELFADDVVWHSPGRNPLSGDYRGRDAVFGLFARLADETGGTFRADVHDLLANDEHGVGLVTVTARRGDRSLTVNDVNVFHLRDGRVTECWLASTDQDAEDQFWS